MKAREAKGPVGEIDRRRFLVRSATASAAIIISGGALIHPGEAWGLEVASLSPGAMRTLVKIARDIYPHDRLPDKYYAVAVKGYDQKAADNPGVKTVIEDGITLVDELAKAQHGVAYAEIGWEEPRVAILKEVEATPFFVMIRAGLVVGLYNQKEIWPLFGYEGESASEGGYINRGFNDLTWL